MNVPDAAAVPPLPDQSLHGSGRFVVGWSLMEGMGAFFLSRLRLPVGSVGRIFQRKFFRWATVGFGVGLSLAAGSWAEAEEEGRLRSSGGIRSDLPSLRRDSTSADLTLDRRGERKAEALAAFSSGIAAEDNADIERALQAYRRSLELDPSNTELAVKVGLELARRDQVPEGINLLKDAEKAAPKDSLPPLCLSQIYGKFLNKPQLAERYAQKAISLAPENFSTHLALFDLYASTGQGRKADQVLEKAFRSKTTNPEFWLQLAEVTIRLSRHRTGGLSEEERKRVETMFSKALKENGDETLAARLAKAGDLYGILRDHERAIPLYQQALADGKTLDTDERVALRNKLAQMLIAEKRQEEAIVTLEALLKEAPTRYETYELLGGLYEESQQIRKAIGCYQQALTMDPTQPTRFLRIAQMQLQENLFGPAIETLTDAKRRFPGNARITYSLALAQANHGEYQRALVSFAEALDEAETLDRTVLTAEFYLHYGKTAQHAGDISTSARMLRKCIELDPNNAADAYNNLGYMWANQGVYLPEALELIKRALALDPENPAYLDSLGWCYHRMGQHQEALEPLLRAIELDENAMVFEHLGDVYEALGQKEKAREQWQKALAINPENTALKKKSGHSDQAAQP